jgi:hydrogenase expression/formation protein HypD
MTATAVSREVEQLKFRDPAQARALADAIARNCAAMGSEPVSIMHVCGSHEQSIAKFGLRATFPKQLDVIMGPGCPVCVTDLPEVDEAVVLAESGVRVVTYGDMLRVPGTVKSLADAQTEGAPVSVVYGAAQAVQIARENDEQVVFLASGFETTAVATAALVLRRISRCSRRTSTSRQ